MKEWQAKLEAALLANRINCDGDKVVWFTGMTSGSNCCETTYPVLVHEWQIKRHGEENAIEECHIELRKATASVVHNLFIHADMFHHMESFKERLNIHPDINWETMLIYTLMWNGRVVFTEDIVMTDWAYMMACPDIVLRDLKDTAA